ncbi:epoxyqueuosine reductase [Aminobacter sp. J15]|nr:epoxyqueuosine reductase [Aminobacter sp. J15]
MEAVLKPVSTDRLRTFLDTEARKLGFDAIAVASPDSIPLAPSRLAAFVELGRHGTMDWMPETMLRRGNPKVLWPEVRSVIMLGMNYGPDTDPMALLERKDRAAISVYARNRDYHDVIKGKLKELAQKFASRSGADVKVFVDTAPVMEKPLAAARASIPIW